MTAHITSRDVSAPLSTNPHLLRWVRKMADLTRPAAIHWVDGSEEEYDLLCEQMVRSGTLMRLNQDLWPAASTRGRIPTTSRASNRAPSSARCRRTAPARPTTGSTRSRCARKLKELFSGAMAGRTMYVLPFSMGPVGSPMSQIGVQLTDSPYVVVSMRIMARIGLPVLRGDRQGRASASCRACTASARRSRPGRRTCPGRATRRSTSSTFPETREIWSYGSGYGGNALLGKKCFGLRIASNIARDEGWMAEHMLILGVEDPQGEKTYVAAAFPSACGKTNFAMLIPPDGIRRAGRSRRSATTSPGSSRTPTAGCARSIPRPASSASRRARRRRPIRTRWRRIARNTIFTNVALTPEGGVWWEGMTDEPPAECLDWQGKRWTPEIGRDDRREGGASQRALHRAGVAVPDHRLRLGGSRTACRSARSSSAAAARTTMPLVYQAFNWSVRRLRRRDDGLGDDRRRGRQRRQGAARSDGDAAVLRLPHGRLLPALDQDAARAQRDAEASST